MYLRFIIYKYILDSTIRNIFLTQFKIYYIFRNLMNCKILNNILNSTIQKFHDQAFQGKSNTITKEKEYYETKPNSTRRQRE